MKAEQFHEMDHVEQALLDWARWMRSDVPVRGYPARSVGISAGGTSQSFDDMCEALDARLAEMVDAVIDDLPLPEQRALHHAYLSAVWRMHDYEATLARAKEGVRDGLRAKGYWLGE